ncbi:MAG TPA: MFS transporter [Ktedonobacteraceae bacterium]|nr:MFS transporter [Ktedonobacteraceae bacterium]
MRWQLHGLWKNPDFRCLWTGQVVSQLGSGITGIALPVTAVLVLAATPVQMGILTSLDGLAILLFGLFAGVWVDRLPRRPLMIAMDLGRALLLLSIPLAAFLGILQLGQLYLVAALVGIGGVFFDAAAPTLLPSMIQSPEELIEGNSKLGMADALAEIAGPTAAGALVQLLSPPLAIACDALSFLISALCLRGIRGMESVPSIRSKRQKVWQESKEGLLFVLREPRLLALVGSAGLFNFTGIFIGTLYAFYVIRDLHVTPLILGVLIAAGGLSSLLGAWMAERVIKRFGPGRVVGCALAFYGITGIFVPLVTTPTSLVIAVLLTSQLVGDMGVSIYQISELSLRQTLTPPALQGRVNSTVQFLTRGVLPPGALIAGLLASLIGVRWTLMMGVLGVTAAGLWLRFSPVRHVQTLVMPAESEQA